MKPTTIRVDDNLLAQIDLLAGTVERSRTWIINDALRQYVEHQQWMTTAIEAAVDDADRGVEAIPHSQVAAELDAKLRKAASGED